MTLSRWNILVMALCTGLIVANIYYSQPLLVLMSEEFGVSESNAGQVTFFTQLGYALGLLFCVPLADCGNDAGGRGGVSGGCQIG